MKTVWKSRKCYQHQKVPGKSWKTDKIYQRSKYQENPEIHESYQKSGNWNIKKKNMQNVEKFLQKVKQGPYYICITYLWNLYQHSVRLSKLEEYDILIAELYYLEKVFVKSCIHVEHVISILIKLRFHIKQSTLTWF